MSVFSLTSNFSNGTHFQENLRCDFSTNSSAAQISKILAYAIILFSSLVGNVFIIVIVYKRQELRKTINYFIVNMAVSDFLFPLTAIPVSITEIASGSLHWPISGTAGVILCKLKWFLQAVSITVSTGSLVWIALDRFLAVVFPMKLHLISSRFRAFAIASTWIVAMLGNAFHIYALELVEINEQEIICSNFNNTSIIYMAYSKAYTVLFQIAPLVLLTVLYFVIAVSLRRQDKALCSPSAQQLQIHQRKRRAIKMTFCIMVSFYICVSPIVSYFILWEYEITLSCSFSSMLLFISSLMLYLSSTINPIICMTFVQSYRHGLKEILNYCWCKRFTTRNVEINEQEEINLQGIREE